MRSTKGVLWNALGSALSQPIGFLSTIVLARILTPGDFGLIAMAAVFLGVASTINEFGLSAAIVQRPDLNENETHSIFWVNLGIGLVMFLVGVVVAWPVAAFYRQPSLVPIVSVLSLAFVISSFSLVPRALLQRQLEFKQIAYGNLLLAIANAVVSVTLALLGAGVWALVLGGLVGSAVQAAWLQLRCHWMPRLHFLWAEAVSSARFGGVLTVAGLANYASGNVDYLMLGRFFGPGVVGIYTMAFNLMTLPFRKISGAVSDVTFPALSSLNREPERFREGYLKSSRYVAVVVTPLLVSAVVYAHGLIVGLYGAKWEGSVLPFQILAIAGLFKAITSLVGSVYMGKGRPDLSLWTAVGAMVAVSIGVIAGLPWAAVGVSIGVTVATVLVSLVGQYLGNRLIGITTSRFLRDMGPAAGTGLLALGLALAAAVAMRPFQLPELVASLVGLAFALCGTWLIGRNVFSTIGDLEHLLVSAIRQRSSATAKSDSM